MTARPLFLTLKDMKDYTGRPGHRAPEGYDPASYERPSVACDVVILAFKDQRLKILLIERERDPYKGYWAFPGGFVEMDESLESAASREVSEETGVSGLSLIPLGAYGDPERDPRTRVISAAYLALVRADRLEPRAGDDAKAVKWFPLSKHPELAFDHHKILKDAQDRLKEIAVLTPRIFELLPQEFSAQQLLTLAREIMSHSYDDQAFYKSLQIVPCFVPSEKKPGGGQKYRFSKEDYHTGDLMFMLLSRPEAAGHSGGGGP